MSWPFSMGSSGICAAVAVTAAIEVAKISRAHRHMVRRRAESRVGTNPTKQFSAEAQEAIKQNEQLAQATLEAATPVPQSFQQAVSWAGAASLQAAEAGKDRQTMYFNAGNSESDMSGEISNVLQFAEQLTKLLASSGAVEKRVKAVFTDMGASAMAVQRWEPLPEKLDLTYLPPISMNKGSTQEEKRQLKAIFDDAGILVIIAPRQQELPALLQLFEVMSSEGADMPLVMLNPRLITNRQAAAGAMMRSYGQMLQTLAPVFHLEQIEPTEKDGSGDLNDAVLARVWPRPFSVWEDNPDDPDAVDGYFLLDLNESEAPSTGTVIELLTLSRQAAKRLAKKNSASR